MEPHIITTIGLVLDIVGASFLAYEVFWRRGNEFQIECRRSAIESTRDAITTQIFALNFIINSTSDEFAINRKVFEDEKNQAESELNETVDKLEREIEMIDSRGQKLGYFGFLLLIGGFLIQIWAAWIPSP